MVALARSGLDANDIMIFDGKINIWNFTKIVKANHYKIIELKLPIN